MSLMVVWVKRSTYLSLEGSSWNAFMVMINNQDKKYMNYSANKNLFKTVK